MITTLLPLLLAAQTAASGNAPPGGGQTLQARFDEASDLAADGKCREALPKFKTLEAEPAAQRSPIVQAAIAVRKGICMAGIEQPETVVATIRAGLPLLESKGEAFGPDVRRAHGLLGRIALTNLDYAGAAAEFKAALKDATGADRLAPLLSLSQVLAFDHDGQALRYVEEARALVTADPKADKKLVALVQTQYARVLLTEGRHKEAYAVLRDSLAKQGGLTKRVTTSDITTRSDLAIAAMLNGDRDNARKYLAFAGAGTATADGFKKAASRESPQCSSLPGVTPNDFAIVEFSLSDTGEVLGVMPIYVPAGREVALGFARAVRQWSWTPEAAKTLPPFFRQSIRIELRCSRAGERPEVDAPLETAVNEWLSDQAGIRTQWAAQPYARAWLLQDAAFRAAEATADRRAALAAALAVAANPAAPEAERKQRAERAAALAEALAAPTWVQVRAMLLAIGSNGSDYEQENKLRRALLDRPAVQADPLSRASIRMIVATSPRLLHRPRDADALLNAVSEDQGLPERHPLRIAALIERANIAARKGDLAGARALFDRTGLTEQQCSMVGVRPAVRSFGDVNNDYSWIGFDGWVSMEFDIGAAGQPIAPRVISSYPPFIFDGASAEYFKAMRYMGSFRPSKGVACSAHQEWMTFKTP